MKTYTFKVSKIVYAPSKQVYAKWTDLKLAKKVTAPEGCTIQSFKADFRVGGDYQSVMKTPNGIMKSKGTYIEIVPNKKIVQTFVWDQPDTEVNFLVIEFVAQGKNTVLSIHGAGYSIKSEAHANQEGWASTLEVFSQSFD